jgi:kynureninase
MEAQAADGADPLAPYRDEFVVEAGGPIYLDGNSLGRLPLATVATVNDLLTEWAGQLVGGWDHWVDLPFVVGDRVGGLIGAAPGQVVVSDSTSVNLYKLAVAALDARPGRTAIVADANDFPTVRYVLQGLAARSGHRLYLVDSAPMEQLDAGRLAQAMGVMGDDVALVCLSAVNFRSGAVADMVAVDDLAHAAGALTLWDLSHAAGAVPLELDAAGADLAVGCGYKYLNGGPGAPAWLYVRSSLQAALRQPIWGWWGQHDQFAMGEGYEPVEGMGRFLVGTPAVLGIAALGSGLAPLVRAGIPALWHKTQRLVDLLAERAARVLAPLGTHLASPADPAHRGAHLSLSHPQAWPAARLLIDRGLVVPDFRPPDVLRLAPVPLYTTYTEVWDAVERIAGVLSDPAIGEPVPKRRVT